MNQTAKPRRRWSCFSLRTLLVAMMIAALPLAWLGRQIQWVRERHEFLDSRTGEYNQSPDYRSLGFNVTEAPGCLWLLGEEPVRDVWVYYDEPEQTAVTAARLFPEADLVRSAR